MTHMADVSEELLIRRVPFRLAANLRLCRLLAPFVAVSMLFNPWTLHAMGARVPYAVSFLWSPLVALYVAMLLACTTEIALVVLRPALEAVRGVAALVLDDGGVRVVRPRPRTCSYLPFESIGACVLCDNGVVLRVARRDPCPTFGPHATSSRGAALILHNIRGERLLEASLQASSMDAAIRLLDKLEMDPLDARGPSHLQSLRRHGQPLASWAKHLRDQGCGAAASPYRSVVPPQRVLEEAIADPTLPVDIRVGAVFAASALSSDAADCGVGADAPPLLLAAVDAMFPSRASARLVSHLRVRAHLAVADWQALRALRRAARSPRRPGETA